MNQHATSIPTANRIVQMVNQSLRLHHKVIRKPPARTKEQTFEAMMLNPQAINAAPMSDEPR